MSKQSFALYFLHSKFSKKKFKFKKHKIYIIFFTSKLIYENEKIVFRRFFFEKDFKISNFLASLLLLVFKLNF